MSAQQAMVDRVKELERMVAQLNGQIGVLRRELMHTKQGLLQAWSGGSCLRTLFGGIKPVTPNRTPVRENRRVERHEHCLF
ncbi:MAG: hypothetical protein OJF47_001284 [Nitrospira sp.]|jgi:hypothetical protein|nr:MAG: hypothetical protein OJF47_001284 [Nitrospira sp.]